MTRAEGIHVVSMSDSDFGSERRIRITLDGRTIELTVCNGSSGYELDLWELGPPEREYRLGRKLFGVKAARGEEST